MERKRRLLLHQEEIENIWFFLYLIEEFLRHDTGMKYFRPRKQHLVQDLYTPAMLVEISSIAHESFYQKKTSSLLLYRQH